MPGFLLGELMITKQLMIAFWKKLQHWFKQLVKDGMDNNNQIINNVIGSKNNTRIQQIINIEKKKEQPLEIMMDALLDVDNWKEFDGINSWYFYNDNFDDIRFVCIGINQEEPYKPIWVCTRSDTSWDPNHKAYKVVFEYNGQRKWDHLDIRLGSIDGGRDYIVQPEQVSSDCYIGDCKVLYYYVKDSREYLLSLIVGKLYPLHNNALMFKFPVFNSKEEAHTALLRSINSREYGYYDIKPGKVEYIKPLSYQLPSHLSPWSNNPDQ